MTLRVLFARTGIPHCPTCGRPVRAQSAQQIVDQIAALPAGTRFQVLAPVARGRKGTHDDLLQQARTDGYARARIDGVPVELTDRIKLAKTKKHDVEIVVDRLVVPGAVGSDEEDGLPRLTDSVGRRCSWPRAVVRRRAGRRMLTFSIELVPGVRHQLSRAVTANVQAPLAPWACVPTATAWARR